MGKWYKKIGKTIGETLVSSFTGGLLGKNDALGSGNPIGGEFGANFFDPLDISGTTARKYQASEAEKERVWQEQMSNTAHQREMADLKAAGINPIMTVNGGQGATSSSGAAASGVNTNGAEQIATLLNAFSQIKNASSTAKATKSQADLNTEQEKNVQNEIINRNINTAQNIAESSARINHLNEQTRSEAIDNHINEMLGLSKQDTGQTRQAAWIYHNSKERKEINKAAENAVDKDFINKINKERKKAENEFNKKVLSKLSKQETVRYAHGNKQERYKLAKIAKQRGAFD